MISNNVKKFCCEDLSLIENYDKAIKDNQMWHCHHRLEIELNKSKQELIDLNLYYDRPACELILLTQKEHKSLHFTYRHYRHTEESKKKIGESGKGRTPWNKGLKGVMYHSEETRKKQSESHKGKPAWNKGRHRVYDEDGSYHYE